MVTSIVLVIVGIILFAVLYFLACILGLIFMGGVPKEVEITYNLCLYLIPGFVIGYGIYGIIKYLFL